MKRFYEGVATDEPLRALYPEEDLGPAEVRLRMYTQLITRSRQKSAIDTDFFCESFRYTKSVDDGGLAQMQRLLQFGRELSHAL